MFIQMFETLLGKSIRMVPISLSRIYARYGCFSFFWARFYVTFIHMINTLFQVSYTRHKLKAWKIGLAAIMILGIWLYS